MSDVILSMQDVFKRYGRRKALDGLTMSVRRGTVTGLVGSNGAGKTTSMSMAAGIIRPTRGYVDVLGSGPFDPLVHTGRVSLLPQDALLPAVARVGDLLCFYAMLQGMPRADAEPHVTEVLDWVHLLDRRESVIRTLSHGMRRRVTVAQAFLGNPELILLDEPLSGLDPREVVNIRNLLRERRGKQTIVISSHNLHEIELVCDHVVFIEHGRTLRQDTLASVTESRQALTFILEGAAPDTEALEALLPDGDCTLDENGRRLVCRFGANQSITRINRVVLEHLFSVGVGVLEIRRGAALEKAYLDNTQKG